MKHVQAHKQVLSLSLLLGWHALVYAESVDNVDPPVTQNIMSLHAQQADWAFSGMVINESGERYGYFFEIQRNYNHFHALATIIDGQTKAVLVYEEANTLIENPELTHWQVGTMFLRFNPISNSWVFGVKDKKKGFNFKVDMLGLNDTIVKRRELRAGVEFLINQTGRLNGHLQADEVKEQFVTAKRAWFRQIWVNKPQKVKHSIKSVLCNFNNGSALYSVTLQEADTLQGSIAGWRDEQGMPVSMSQFVTVRQAKDSAWTIHVPSPKVTLTFQDLLPKINGSQQLVLGLTTGVMPGFCAISYNDIDEHFVEQTIETKEKGNG